VVFFGAAQGVRGAESASWSIESPLDTP
jgi:hypothetical protein